MREHYFFGISEAARNAKILGVPAISIIEFGVSGGMGLLSMEQIANHVETQYGVHIQIYGFDLGSGLPTPVDYRDLAYTWQPGFYKMDREQLEKRLQRSVLIIGDVADTTKSFFDLHQPPPIGFMSFDLDLYSSTKSAFRVLGTEDTKRFLPRTYCYFDDIIGDHDEIHCEYVGELLAINEFNKEHRYRKIAKINGLRIKVQRPFAFWPDQIYVLHLFQHELYNTYIRSESDRQTPLLPSSPLAIAKKVLPSEINFEAVHWQFARADGSVIAPKIILRSNGSIEGYRHRNEAAWSIQGETIVFRGEDNQPTTHFKSIGFSEAGKLIAVGDFLLQSGIVVVLTAHPA